jgi:hypothetical protein
MLKIMKHKRRNKMKILQTIFEAAANISANLEDSAQQDIQRHGVDSPRSLLAIAKEIGEVACDTVAVATALTAKAIGRPLDL